jgi:large subunit ribosomal protein L10
MSYETKSNDLKRKAVEDFKKLVSEYPIIAAVNMEGLPTPQLQAIRAKLRGTVVLRMAKRRLLKLAIESSDKKDIKELLPFLKGMPALLFTKDNPFKLFKVLKQNKSNAPAKAGQIAPKDVLVSAGPTNFAPGPIIGELGAFKIKTGVEGGKLAIKEDVIVAKEGDVISSGLASVLTRLGIQPMEVGLDVVAVYDTGVIYTKSVLDVDENKIRSDAEIFAAQAFNLAMNAGIIVKETVEPLLIKAAAEARTLALEQNILTKETAEALVAKAAAQATSLQQHTT